MKCRQSKSKLCSGQAVHDAGTEVQSGGFASGGAASVGVAFGELHLGKLHLWELRLG